MMAATYPTKKAMRESIGTRVKLVETSVFGPEYPPGGTGSLTVVGPTPYKRKWYAEIQIEKHIITSVK